MGTTMTLAAALLIVFSKGASGLTIKGGVAGLILTYTQQVSEWRLSFDSVRPACQRYNASAAAVFIEVPPLKW